MRVMAEYVRSSRGPLLWATTAGVLLTLLMLAAAPAEDKSTALSQERAIFRAFDGRDYDRAIRLIEGYLEDRPNSPNMLYNLACAYCQVDRLEDGASTLFKAVEAGFRDFEHLRTDPDLAKLRTEPMYQAILKASRRAKTSRAEDALARWKNRFGAEAYRYEIDEQRRLTFATALDDVSHREMRSMLERQADILRKMLFGPPPDYYVLIAIPTPRDAGSLFDSESIGGRYEHPGRWVISREIGGSLRHEFVHALHYGHMERMGLNRAHPIWIQEGLATLFEDYEISGDSIRFLPNERMNIVKRLGRIGRLTKWDTLFNMSSERFMGRPGQTYPQVRAIFEFIADEGKLSAWYASYVAHFEEDASGVAAFEDVFEKPIELVEDKFRRWVKRQPMVDVVVNSGDASLGIESDLNSANDGVLVMRVLPGSGAARARVRAGDVIVSIDGQHTRSFQELVKIIGTRSVGQAVELRMRRRGEYLTKRIVLQPRG